MTTAENRIVRDPMTDIELIKLSKVHDDGCSDYRGGGDALVMFKDGVLREMKYNTFGNQDDIENQREAAARWAKEWKNIEVFKVYVTCYELYNIAKMETIAEMNNRIESP